MDDRSIDLRGGDAGFAVAERTTQDPQSEAYRFAWRPHGSRSLSSWGSASNQQRGRTGVSELYSASALFEG